MIFRELGFLLAVSVTFLVFGLVYAYIKISDRQSPLQVSIEIPLPAKETDTSRLPSNRGVE